MKAILKDGTELTVNSYANISDNRVQISFAGITSYDTLKSKLVVAATKTIKIYTDNTSFVTFENYTKIVDPCTVTTAADNTLDVLVIFEREDEISQRIRALEETAALNSVAIDNITTDFLPTIMEEIATLQAGGGV
jgi:hypothetical protein